MDKQVYFYRYIWHCREGDIEMAGIFTKAQWQHFREEPHPIRKDITIITLYKEPFNGHSST